MIWQLQEAKQRFSEVIRRARTEGPQVVTRRGARAVVVLSAEDYDELACKHPDFVAFLLSGPEFDALELQRSSDLPREVAL